MKATSFRRQIIVAVLLALALAGAALRWWAPDPSLTRDFGTLLLVLWVPAVGNIIAFLVRKLRQPAAAGPAFATEAFTAQLEVELRPFAPPVRAPLAPLPPGADRCTLILGTDGFTARLSRPLAGWLSQNEAQALQLEFLRPALALPRFPAGTAFRLATGTAVVGEGRVLRVLGRDAAAPADPVSRSPLTQPPTAGGQQ